jgi:hypothetical protein
VNRLLCNQYADATHLREGSQRRCEGFSVGWHDDERAVTEVANANPNRIRERVHSKFSGDFYAPVLDGPLQGMEGRLRR